MTDAPDKNPKAKKQSQGPKKFYQLKLFWFLVVMGLITTFVGVMNWVINNPAYQKRAADLLYELTGTGLSFKDIRVNLFVGEVAGTDLAVTVEPVNLRLSLKQFKLNYNPLYLLVARLKLTRIQASEFRLDTSQLIKKDTKREVKIPVFLRRVRLKQARIDKFFWNQPGGRQLSVGRIRLTSEFASVFYRTPLTMVIHDIRYRSPNLDVFVAASKMDGFFLFDFSAPRILDESRLSAEAAIDRILVAVHRKHKPWLTARGWDRDLDSVLKKFYPLEIPKDRSYLLVNRVFLDVEKTAQSFRLNNLKVDYYQKHLVGKGVLKSQWDDFAFELKTLSPMPLSKLPLGQSRFREAFESFAFDLKLNGKFTSLKKHNLALNLDASLIGNRINPAAGNAVGRLSGKIVNGEIIADDVSIRLGDGSVTGATRLKLKTLTTRTRFKAQGMDAHTVVGLFSGVNIPSQVDGKGSVTGKLTNPRISIDMTTEDAVYEFLHFGRATGTLLIQNKNLNLDVKTNGSAVGQSELTMTIHDVFSSFDQTLKLSSTHTDLDITALLNAPSLAGKIGGRFELKRVNAVVTGKGAFQARSFSFFKHPVGDVNFETDLKQKHLEVRPITVALVQPKKTIASRHGLTFDFEDTGFRFRGTLVENMDISGSFSKADPTYLNLDIAARNLSLDLFTSLMPVRPIRSGVTGKIDLKYHIYRPALSRMNGSFSKIELQTADSQLTLNRAAGLDYVDQAFVFKNFDVSVGRGRVVLNGPLGLASNSALHIRGAVDFEPFVDYNPYISESDMPINVDLTLRDNIFKPRVYGRVTFRDDSIRFRNFATDLENLNGTLTFEGDRISSEALRLHYNDAPVTLAGWVTTDYEQITGANLRIKGQEVPFYPVEGLSLYADINLLLTGQAPITLSGTMNIVDGQYTRDFAITNFFIKPVDEPFDIERDTLGGLPLTTRYRLHIKNTGDLLIKNNLADLEISADLDLAGTMGDPDLIGQIDVLGGQIHAFGVDFNDAQGYAQFKRGAGHTPEVNVTARKGIQEYNIIARIEGRTDNLRLRLDATPALDRREILSVIFYGQTPDQLIGLTRRDFTQTAAISQLATILAPPLYKLSGLDLLMVTPRQATATESIQRLTVGKTLSSRFSLAFTSDLGINDPEQAFELRYQILDNFYLIAAKDVIDENRYRFDISFRFELY